MCAYDRHARTQINDIWSTHKHNARNLWQYGLLFTIDDTIMSCNQTGNIIYIIVLITLCSNNDIERKQIKMLQ